MVAPFGGINRTNRKARSRPAASIACELAFAREMARGEAAGLDLGQRRLALGAWPSSGGFVRLRSIATSGIGTAAMSERVEGWSGRSNSSPGTPCRRATGAASRITLLTELRVLQGLEVIVEIGGRRRRIDAVHYTDDEINVHAVRCERAVQQLEPPIGLCWRRPGSGPSLHTRSRTITR